MRNVLILIASLICTSCEQDLVKPLGNACPLPKDRPAPQDLGCEFDNASPAVWSVIASQLDSDPMLLESWEGACLRVEGVAQVEQRDEYGQRRVSFIGGSDPDHPQVLRCCPHGDYGTLTSWGAAETGDKMIFWGLASGNETTGYCIKSCSVKLYGMKAH